MLFKQKKKLLLTEDSKDLGLCTLFKPDGTAEDGTNGQSEDVDFSNGQATGEQAS